MLQNVKKKKKKMQRIEEKNMSRYFWLELFSLRNIISKHRNFIV